MGEGRVSVQEHEREGAQDRELQLESKKIIFSLTLCVQRPCKVLVHPHRRPWWVFETPWDSQIKPVRHLAKRGFCGRSIRERKIQNFSQLH